MLEIFAQTPAQPTTFGDWIANAFYLVGLVTAGVVLYQRVRPRPAAATEIAGQPLSVRAAIEYATKGELAEVKADVARIRDEVTERFDALDHKRSVSIAGIHSKVEQTAAQIRQEIKTDVGGVHVRINEVLAAVSKVEGKLSSP